MSDEEEATMVFLTILEREKASRILEEQKIHLPASGIFIKKVSEPERVLDVLQSQEFDIEYIRIRRAGSWH